MQLDRDSFYNKCIDIFDSCMDKFFDTDIKKIGAVCKFENRGYFRLEYKYYPHNYRIVVENEIRTFNIEIIDAEQASASLGQICEYGSDLNAEWIERSIKLLKAVLLKNEFNMYFHKDGKYYKKNADGIKRLKNIDEAEADMLEQRERHKELLNEWYDWKIDEVEDIIWDAFNNKGDTGVIQFLPKLKKYDGINALKESPYLKRIPSEISAEIGKILYESTGNEEYLDVIKRNMDACPYKLPFVSMLSYCKPCFKLNKLLIDVYINDENEVNRNTAVMGILYGKGIINDRFSIQEANDTLELRNKFKSKSKVERRSIINRFESGKLI
ncbi:MAG: hypothetical protein NC489_42845 [Ruminococcus flavefaciens]|nr:hypothetical protein [Ruminococcus flavefaciens]